MDDYIKENDAANTAILEEILNSSPSDEVKKLLSAYNVGNKSLTKIIKEMQAADPESVGQAAVYLQLTDIDISSKATTRLLCKEIIRALDNAMREKCGVCDKWYNVTINETPVIQCTVCGQGCHTECYTEHTINLPGIYFRCTTCDNNKKEKQKAVKEPIKPPSQDAVAAKEKPAESANPTESTNNLSRTLHLDDTLHLEDSDEDEIEPFQRPQPRESSQQPAKLICPQYQFGRCNNYEICKEQYDHPRRCRNWMQYGRCRFTTSCKYSHPKICFNSLSERKCTNLECNYFHLKYTRRYENPLSDEVVAEYQTPPQSSNYPPLPPPANHFHQQVPNNRTQQPPTWHHQQLSPPTHPKTPTNPQCQQSPTSHENHFLYQHIKETNTTMKNLQNLIISLLNAQTKPALPVPQQLPQPLPISQNQFQAENMIAPQMQPIHIQQIQPAPTTQQAFHLMPQKLQ